MKVHRRLLYKTEQVCGDGTWQHAQHTDKYMIMTVTIISSSYYY